jgi:uncharacterized protein YfaS (alpha-2-macroglobulin family)
MKVAVCSRRRGGASLPKILLALVSAWALAASLCVQSAPAAGVTPTVVLGWSPGIGRAVPLRAPITVYFNRPMNAASVQLAWGITPPVAGALGGGPAAFTFRPTTPFRPGVTYHLRITSTAQAVNRLPLSSPFAAAFTAGDGLRVTSFSPAQGTTGVRPAGLLAITFNHPMVPLRGIDVPATNPPGWRVTISPRLPGTGAWLGTSTWVFHPQSGLQPSSRYTVTLAGSARDQWGEPLGRGLRWSFRTLTPEVIGRAPRRDARYVGPRATVSVTFNQPMDHHSVARVVAVRTGGAAVHGRISWQGDRLTFRPAQLLLPGRIYTVSIAGSARSANRAATLGKTVSWSFSSAPLPRLTVTDPGEGGIAYGGQDLQFGAPDVNTAYTATFSFNTPMNKASLDRRLSISPEISNLQTFISADGYANWRYVVAGSFSPSSHYTISLAPGTTDIFGRPLGGPVTLHFKTSRLIPSVALYGVPGASSGIAFSAGRVVPAPIQLINVPRVHYQLVRTTLAALSDRCCSDAGSPPAGTTVRRWTQSTAHSLNKIENLNVQLAGKDGTPLQPGLYWLGATTDEGLPGLPPDASSPSSDEIVVVNNVNLTLKIGGNESLVWANSTRTGKPLPGLTVKLVNYQGTQQATGQTDSQGIHLFNWRSNWSPVNALVDDGRHFGLAEQGWSPTVRGPAIPYAYFGFPFFAESGGTYLYTDRPIYRPGQTVYFHGLLWRDQDAVYSRFGRRTAFLRANDSLGRVLYHARVTLDRFGAVRGSFRLPNGTPTGVDGITVTIPHTAGTSTNFTVAEYRKPEFLATVKANQPAFIQGRTLTATAKVTYVFGTPVIHRRVSWVAYRQPLFPQPRGWDSYSFFDWEDAWQQGINFNQQPPSQFGWPVASGHGLTGPHGRLTFRLPISLARERFDQTLTVEVTATDLNHQSVSSRVLVPAYRSDLTIGLNPQSQVVAAGKPATVEVAAVKPDGTPRAGQQLTASIVKRTYTNRLVTDRFGHTSWQSVPHDTMLETRTLTTDVHGTATVTFTPPSGGEYRVVVQGRDELGNAAETTQTIDASSAESANWGITADTSLLLKPDKATYSVGETAHVLVPAPFANGNALITVERGYIRRYWVERLPTNSSTVDIPITIDDLPNVYVTVTLFHGPRDGTPAEWRYGQTELHVRVDPKHLIVKVAQAGFRHHPGDPVTYRVTTVDATGRPVSAELSLALVDTAVLALQNELNPDILSAFYAERGQGVSTMSEAVLSIDHLQVKPGFYVQGFHTVLAQASYGAKQGAAPALSVPITGGGGPGAGGNPGITVRSNFADTAYWAGSLRTNRAGKAIIHLRLPDNATTWRLDARGVALNQSVGQAQLHTLATQDLVLRPVLPRFLLEGISLQVGTVLNNNLNRPVQVRVSLSAGGLEVGNHTARLLSVPAHGERMALWPATVPVTKAASVTVLAIPLTAGVRGDAVRLRLPVYPPLTDETVATAGQVYGALRQLVILPRGAVARPGALTVRVSASLVAGLGAAYRDFRPLVTESNQNIADRVRTAAALRSLPMAITGLKAAVYHRLPADIAAGVAKLLGRQYPDGGWPWFNAPQEPSDPWITADAVQALHAAGVRTPAVRQAIDRARGFIVNALNSPTRYGPPSPALMLALARTGPAPLGLAEDLYSNTIRRSRLDSASLADLALTFALDHDAAKARTLAAALDGRAMVSATGAHWETGTQDSWYGPPIAATTEALGALLAISPHDPFVPAGVRWLMLARQGADWDCPPDTADALVTLSGYARAAREGHADYRYEIAVDGRTRLSGGYAGAAQTGVGRVRVPTAQLRRNGASALVIGRHLADGSFGRGPLYYLAQLKYYLQANAIAPRDEGVSVSRRYLTLQGRPIDQISAGSPLKVQLTIRTTQTLLYLDIQDPLPVGCEPIDSSLNTSQQGLFRPQFWWRPFSQVQDLTWYLSHSDLRDNRVSLYAYYLPPGVYRYTYLAQATVPGRYGVPPTHVQETYFPEVFGRSAGQVFTVS